MPPRCLGLKQSRHRRQSWTACGPSPISSWKLTMTCTVKEKRNGNSVGLAFLASPFVFTGLPRPVRIASYYRDWPRRRRSSAPLAGRLDAVISSRLRPTVRGSAPQPARSSASAMLRASRSRRSISDARSIELYRGLVRSTAACYCCCATSKKRKMDHAFELKKSFAQCD